MNTPDPLLLGLARAPVVANHPRKPAVALLLAFLCPGLGHLYCGAVPAALAWAVVPHVVLMAVFYSGVVHPQWLHVHALTAMGTWLAMRAVQMVLAWRLAARLPQYVLRSFNTPALYVAFFLGTSIAGSLMSLPAREAWVETHKVQAPGMSPVVEVNESVFVVKVGAGAEPSRGAVIVYEALEKLHVGRVVAVAGEKVELNEGALAVNGSVVATSPRILDLAPVTIPFGSVFVLGDDPDHAVDSRELGPVPASKIVGRAAVVFLSLDPSRIGNKL